MFDELRESAFRLETLTQYLSPGDMKEFEAFKAGQLIPPFTPETSPWMARIQADTAAGKRWYRVHVIDYPLTDYLRWELYAYPGNVAVGEEVYIVDRDTHPELDELRTDFWLLDDRVVLVMHYDGDGRFLHADRAPDEDLDEYRRLRDVALRWAVPLDEYQQRSSV